MGKKRRLVLSRNFQPWLWAIRPLVIQPVQWLTILLCLLPPALSQFTTCFDKLKRNDIDEDSILTSNEFQIFILDMTRGKINLDMQSSARTSIHQAFDVWMNESLGGVDISTVSIGHDSHQGMVLFCENVYQSLSPIFEGSATADECRDALFGNGGQIDTTVFVDLVSTLTGETFVDFEDLGEATQDVYTDFENSNGVVNCGFWASQPLTFDMFCRRVILGTKLDSDVIVEIPGTIQLPTALCLDDLRLADGDGDGLLSENEYISLVNKLSNDFFLFMHFEQLPPVLQNNFAWLSYVASTVERRSLDSTDYTENELRQLGWVCSQTEASISAALDRMTGKNGTGAPFWTDCVAASINSDRNEDGKLSFEEFKTVLRIVASDNIENELLMQTFAEIANEDDLIDLSKVGRYEVVTSTNLDTFEVLCNTILDLLDNEQRDSTPLLATALNFTDDDLPASSEKSPLSHTSVDDRPTLSTPVASSNKPIANPGAFSLPNSVSTTFEPSAETRLRSSPIRESFSPTSTQTLVTSQLNKSNQKLRPSLESEFGTQSPSVSLHTIQPAFQTPPQTTRTPILVPTSPDQPTASPTIRPVIQTFFPSIRAPALPTILPEKRTISPTIQPAIQSLSPSGIAPILYTTAPDDPRTSPTSFVSCTDSMSASDRDHDNKLHSNEFILFLNRRADEAFKDYSFDELPVALQRLYSSLKQSSIALNIFGSKTGQQATESQINNLRQICSETDRFIYGYLQNQQSQPTVPTTATHSRKVLALQAIIDPSEFSQCKTFLFVSDGDRNSQLNSEEYVTFVNRITVNAFLGFSFTDLPLVFRTVFESTSAISGFISIVGARPGQQATVDQVAALESLCSEAYSAGDVWEDSKTTQPTLSPNDGPGGSSSTSVPTLYVENFSFCTTSMAVSDRNGDNVLDEDEYVGLLNRLGQNIYLGVPFTNINSSLQLLFFSLRDASGSISVPGARTGQARTQEETAWLRRVCFDTKTALSDLMTSIAPSPGSIQPTVAPVTASPVASSQTITPIQLARCRAFLSISDRDQNKAIDHIEYVNFLNTLSGNSFLGFEFSDLIPAFQQVFVKLQSADSTVSINGAKPADGESPEEVASLISFCSMVYDTLDFFNNGPPPTQSPMAVPPLDDPVVVECLNRLNEVDLSGDEKIDKFEYMAYVSHLSNETNGNELLFSSLPFVVQDNFRWIKGDSPFVDVGGVGDLSLLKGTGQLTSLARLCRRTAAVIESAMSGNNQTEPIAHCYGSFTSSDANSDNQLTETEFVSTINYFLGLDRSELSITSLEDPFVNFFEANKGFSSGVINIEGSKPWQTPNAVQELTLTYLCDEVVKAVDDSRANYVLRNRCLDAMTQANVDADSVLTQEEYTDFVYSFAGRSRDNHTYAGLPARLVLNFEALRVADNASISINGWPGTELSPIERENIDRVCTATNDALIVAFPSDAPSPAPGNLVNITIYNGFILVGREDLFLSDLEGGLEYVEVEELELAYGLFVEAIVSAQLSARRLRGRKLAILGLLPETPAIYRILSGTCDDSVANSTESCLKVYASFDLLGTQDGDVVNIASQYTTLTQDSIANGALQSQLALLSPNRRFDIIGATDSVLPDIVRPTSTPMAAPITTSLPTGAPVEIDDESRSDASTEGGFPLILLITAGGGALLAIAFVLFWLYIRRRHNNKSVDIFFGKDDVGPHSPDPDENDGHDDDYSLTPSEREDMDEFNAEPKTSNAFLPEASEHNDYGFSNASDHNRTDVEFGRERENDTDHHRDSPGWSPPEAPIGSHEHWKDEICESNENDWDGTAGNLLGTDDDSEGSEESELVVRTSSAASVAASMAGRSMGSRQNETGQGFFPDTSSDEDDSEEEFIGASQDEGELATDLDQSHDGSGTFNNDNDDSFQNGSFGDASFAGGGSRGGEYDEDHGDYDDDFEPSYDNREDGSAYQGSLNTEDKTLEHDFDGSTAEDDTIQSSYVMDETGPGKAARLEYRRRIEELVLQVVPDEVGNVDAMMEQFCGREEELIKTLSTMAKQVKERGGRGDAPWEDGDHSHSDSYRSDSIDGEDEIFDDEGYYNESFEANAEEQYDDDDLHFEEGEDGEEYSDDDDQFQDEDSYGSDYSDHDR